MTPLDELRTALLLAPDDEGPRRVYADALIERGDPRGEYLALQLEGPVPAEARELRARALWQRHGPRWLEEEFGALDRSGPVLTWDRGFVSRVDLSLDELSRLEQPLARQPVRSLRATGLTADLAAVEASALLPRVRELGLEHDLEVVSEEALERVLRRAVNVRSLSLAAHRDAPDCWRPLERWPGLSQLTHLGLSNVRLTAERARWLAAACPSLTSLALRRSADAEALCALAEAAPARLRSLGLADLRREEGLWLPDPALAEVLGSPFAAALRELWLVGCDLGKATAAVVGRLPCAPLLESLDLHASGGRDAASAVLGAELPRLARLSLFDYPLDDAAALQRFTALEELCCATCQLGGAALAGLLDALDGLTTLDLSDTDVADPGALAIAAHPHSGKLRSLGLSACGVTARGVAALAASEHLGGLRQLSLTHSDVARPAIAALAAGPFDAMQALHVAGNVRRGSEALFEDGWMPAEDTTPTSEVWQRRLELDGTASPRRHGRQRGPAPKAPADVKPYDAAGPHVPGQWVSVPEQGAGVVTEVHALHVEARFATGVMRLPVVVKGARPYDLRERYAPGELVQHPTLGAGRVAAATHDRVEVEFGAHGLKKLVHAKR